MSASGIDAEIVLTGLADAIVIVDDGNSITYVNAAAEAMLGWPAADLVGQPLTKIIPERLRDAHLTGFERHLVTGETTLIGKQAVRVPALRHDGSEVEVDLSLNSYEKDGREVFVAALRDVSKEVELERTASLNRALTAARDIALRLAVSPNLGSLDQALPVVLEVTAVTLDWDVAIAWTVERDRLVAGPVWFASTRATAAAEMAGSIRSFARGEGLPGRVWASGLPAVIDDVATDGNFPRGDIAVRHGLATGLGVPIWANGEVIAVTEFFRADPIALDAPALVALGSVGQHVGALLERSVAMRQMEATEARSAAIVSAALDCIVGMDERGIITSFNPAAETVLGWKRDDAIGQPMAELLVPERFRAAHHAGFARHLATGASTILGQRLKLRVLRSDDTEIPVEITITRAEGRNGVAFTGFLRDLSAQEQAEEEARQGRERLAMIAETLQASLAPSDLPPIDGMSVSARFRPAGAGDELGGDFYDVFEYAPKQWCLVIGDVCGKGAEAAVLTALARYTLRAAALERRTPSEMLRLLNQAILREHTDRFASVCVSVISRSDDSWVGATASAGGHPAPLVRRADGATQVVAVDGPLVGLFDDVEFPEVTFELAVGDALVLYTDGVTEAKLDGEWVEEDGLTEIVGAAGDGSADDIAEAIYRTILDGSGSHLRDDLAILVATVDDA